MMMKKSFLGVLISVAALSGFAGCEYYNVAAPPVVVDPVLTEEVAPRDGDPAVIEGGESSSDSGDVIVPERTEEVAREGGEDPVRTDGSDPRYLPPPAIVPEPTTTEPEDPRGPLERWGCVWVRGTDLSNGIARCEVEGWGVFCVTGPEGRLVDCPLAVAVPVSEEADDGKKVVMAPAKTVWVNCNDQRAVAVPVGPVLPKAVCSGSAVAGQKPIYEAVPPPPDEIVPAAPAPYEAVRSEESYSLLNQ